MRKQFKDTVLDLAGHDDKIVVILGDISHFLFNPFQEKYPTRFFNMGICENTLISVAAGLNSQGFHPFVHTITPFITERCLEQIKLDLGYNQFGANIVSTGASFDYAWDGATHHCYTDLAILGSFPAWKSLSPAPRRNSMRSSAASTTMASRRISVFPITATTLTCRPVRQGRHSQGYRRSRDRHDRRADPQ